MSPNGTYLGWQIRRALGGALPRELRLAWIVLPCATVTACTAWVRYDDSRDLVDMSMTFPLTAIATMLALMLAASSHQRSAPRSLLLCGVTMGGALWSRSLAITVRTTVIVAPAAVLAGGLGPRALLSLTIATWSAAAMGTAIKARFSHGAPGPMRWFTGLMAFFVLDWVALDALLRGPYAGAYRLGRLWTTFRSARTDRGVVLVEWLASEPDVPLGAVPAAVPWLIAALLGGVLALGLTSAALRRIEGTP